MKISYLSVQTVKHSENVPVKNAPRMMPCTGGDQSNSAGGSIAARLAVGLPEINDVLWLFAAGLKSDVRLLLLLRLTLLTAAIDINSMGKGSSSWGTWGTMARMAMFRLTRVMYMVAVPRSERKATTRRTEYSFDMGAQGRPSAD